MDLFCGKYQRNEQEFGFAARQDTAPRLRESGKTGSTDVSNISNNSSVGNTTLNTSKKPRVNAESSKQSTLSGFVEPAATASGGTRRLLQIATVTIVKTAFRSKKFCTNLGCWMER